ncbi:MAG TPA: alkaline phosphatase family protein [Ktedonobacteraceae bacterium]|nr:alkaline phosphatase family protein [Ktedonobacteraceae bacterium]
MRAVIFGVDGLSFRILHPLIQRGDLPNFARLQREGVEAEFISAVPAITPPAWMSLVTGLKPAKHGVFDFWEFDTNSETLKSRAVTHRKGGKAVWDILSEYGKRVIVMNVPLTYPPDPVNGIMVSGLMTPSTSSPFTFPHSFKDELYKAVPGYLVDLGSERVTAGRFVDAVLDMTEKRIQLQEHLLSEHDWDFAFLSYVGPDRIQHRIWDSIESLSQEGTKYFRLLDDALGRVLNRLTAEDVLFVASDHGFVGARKWFYINEYLCRRNLLQRDGNAESSRSKLIGFGREAAQKMHLLNLARKARKVYTDFSDEPMMEKSKSHYKPLFESMDWNANRACVLSLTAFGSGMADIFMSPKASAEDMEELRQALAAERHPETGELLAEAVYATDVYGVGPFRPPEEHIVLVPASGTTFHLKRGRKQLWETLDQPKGVHEKEGVFYAWGAGMRQGKRIEPLQIYDLVPTVLQAVGVSANEPFDGHVAQDVFQRVQNNTNDADDLVARKLKRLQVSLPLQ